jgi:hypothetical protein
MAAKKTGPSTLRGSARARAVTVVVLEALSGEVGTTEAAERLGVSLSRYYQLEAKALGGMLKAVEPRTKGPQMTPQREIQALQAEKRGLEKELRRHQTLLRAANRSVGLPARKKKAASFKGRGRAKRGSRGKTVLETLRKTPDTGGGEIDGKAKRDGDTGGEDRGEPGGA